MGSENLGTTYGRGPTLNTLGHNDLSRFLTILLLGHIKSLDFMGAISSSVYIVNVLFHITVPFLAFSYIVIYVKLKDSLKHLHRSYC